MSLGRRALVAVLLTVAFYGLALLLAAGLLLVPIAELVWFNRVTIKLALACVAGAGLVVWSILPRRTPFRPPGPLLAPSSHGRLFAELDDVARRVGEPMPAEVYLALDVNASVGERGSRLGFGGTRVMVVGLPLLQMLRVSELRAVIAHEFGHYYGGDTRLAAWVYRTRVALERTREIGRYSELLHLPFALYRGLFLRVTQSISRRQELAADALAARTVGARAMVGALTAVEHACVAFDAYWRSEMMPVLAAGFRPPLASGFSSFAHRGPVNDVVRQRLADTHGDPHDSHPPPAQRIEALRASPPGPDYSGEPAAIELLDQVPELESALVAGLLRPGVPEPRPIGWEDVGPCVVTPAWERQVAGGGPLLQGLALTSFPGLAAQAEQLGRSLARARGSDAYLSTKDATEIGLSNLAAALGLALIHRGWYVESLPGLPVRLRGQGASLDCRDLLDRLARGELDEAGWLEQCRELGIEDARIGAAAGY